MKNNARMRIVRRSRQAGLTLIELLVALALGLLVAGASIAALIVARQGFGSVDTNAQLRENARFAASLIQRVVIQAGFENAAYGFFTDPKQPGLEGYDNALVDVSSWGAAPTLAHNTRSGCTVADSSCVNKSDVLVVRYFGVSRGGSADGTMISCAGKAEPEGSDRAYSIFHVARSSAGEPTLACTYRDPATGTWTTVPIATGVESFQVLYGVDTVGGDTVADRYYRASDLDSAPTASVTDNWRLVRTVRIGLVIRGPNRDVVGPAAAASMNTLGSGMTATSDVLAVAADGRVRQSLVFTVHLRNAQDAS